MELLYGASGKLYIQEKEYRCDLYYNEKKSLIVLQLNVKNKNFYGSFLAHLFSNTSLIQSLRLIFIISNSLFKI